MMNSSEISSSNGPSTSIGSAEEGDNRKSGHVDSPNEGSHGTVRRLLTRQRVDGIRKPYCTPAWKSELSALGGKVAAEHRKKERTTEEKPRMIGDAIRDDLTDAIRAFVTQGCMRFSSFRTIWQDRKMSLFHFAVPKRINERAFLQQAFSVTLDLLMKDEPTPPPAAVDATTENSRSVAAAANTKESSRKSASAPAAAPLRPTLSSHEVGPGSLPFQIGALYMMYCLHGTQLFRSPSSIRVSAQGMVALVRLRWRLKAAGSLAADALAVLARLALGDNGGGVLQPAAYTGPGTLAYVNSIIPQSMIVKNQKVLVEEETRKEERDQAMAREAKAARVRASRRTAGTVDLAADSPGSTWLSSEGCGIAQRVEPEGLVAPQTKWGPRAREEGAINAVSDRIERLSTAYEQYAEALGRSRSGGGSAASGGDGSTSGQLRPSGKEQGGRDWNPAVDRREHFQRDLADILERSRRKAVLPEAYGLEQLALHPPPPPPGALPCFSPLQIHVPTLPELPARVAIKKLPSASAAAAVVAAAVAREKKRVKQQDGERARQDRGGSAAVGGGRGDGRTAVRDHIALVQKTLDDAERDHEGGDGADRENGGEGEDLQRQERASRRHDVSNGSANRGTVRLPGGLGNSPTQERKVRGGKGGGEGDRRGEMSIRHDQKLSDSDEASDAWEGSTSVPTRPSKNPPRTAKQVRGAQKVGGRGGNGVVRGSTGKKPNSGRAKPSVAGVRTGTRTRMTSSCPQTVDSSSSEEEGDGDPDILASVQEHESFLADIAATVGAGPRGGGSGAENRMDDAQIVAPTTAPCGLDGASSRSRKGTRDAVTPPTRGRGRPRKSAGTGTTSGSAKLKKPRAAATPSPRGGRAGGPIGGRGTGGDKARSGGRGARVSVAVANEVPAKRRRNAPQQATGDAKKKRSDVGVGGLEEERSGQEESSGGEEEEEGKVAALERLADEFSAAATAPPTALSRRAAGTSPPRRRSSSGGIGGGAGRKTGTQREAESNVAGKRKRTATPKAKVKAASTAKSFFVTRSDKAPPPHPPPPQPQRPQRRASGRRSTATKPRGGRSSLTPPLFSSLRVAAANAASRPDTATDAATREDGSAPSPSEATAARGSGTTAYVIAVSGAVSGAAGSLGSVKKMVAITPASSSQQPAAPAVDGRVAGGELGDTSSDSEPDDDAGGGERDSRKTACGGAEVVDGGGFAGGSVSCDGRTRMESTGSGGEQEEGQGKPEDAKVDHGKVNTVAAAASSNAFAATDGGAGGGGQAMTDGAAGHELGDTSSDSEDDDEEG